MEEFTESYADQNGDDAEPPKVEPWWYNTEVFSLQEILDAVPKGMDPSQVVLSVHRDREVTDIQVGLYTKIPNDKKAWQKAHDAEEKEYQEKLAIYQKDKEKYDIWVTQNEIKALEAKLAKLKK